MAAPTSNWAFQSQQMMFPIEQQAIAQGNANMARGADGLANTLSTYAQISLKKQAFAEHAERTTMLQQAESQKLGLQNQKLQNDAASLQIQQQRQMMAGNEIEQKRYASIGGLPGWSADGKTRQAYDLVDGKMQLVDVNDDKHADRLKAKWKDHRRSSSGVSAREADRREAKDAEAARRHLVMEGQGDIRLDQSDQKNTFAELTGDRKHEIATRGADLAVSALENLKQTRADTHEAGKRAHKLRQQMADETNDRATKDRKRVDAAHGLKLQESLQKQLNEKAGQKERAGLEKTRQSEFAIIEKRKVKEHADNEAAIKRDEKVAASERKTKSEESERDFKLRESGEDRMKDRDTVKELNETRMMDSLDDMRDRIKKSMDVKDAELGARGEFGRARISNEQAAQALSQKIMQLKTESAKRDQATEARKATLDLYEMLKEGHENISKAKIDMGGSEEGYAARMAGRGSMKFSPEDITRNNATLKPLNERIARINKMIDESLDRK
jgi:hypothetical protein